MSGFIFPRRRSKKEEIERGLFEGKTRVPQLPLFCAGGGKEKNNRLTLLLPTFSSKENVGARPARGQEVRKSSQSTFFYS